MPRKPAPERVTLTHPSGRFTVSVTVDRAAALAERGYTGYTAPDAAPAADSAPEAADDGYEALTVAKLTDELASRGLPTSGNKADLVARLLDDDDEHSGDDADDEG
jgi:hypothetical protein